MYDVCIMKIPTDMDVPEMRRDTSKTENVAWLIRNLAVRNSRHPEFNRVMEELREERKQR